MSEVAELIFDLEASFDPPLNSHAKAGRRLFNVVDWTGGHRGQIALTDEEAQALNPLRPAEATLTARVAELERERDEARSSVAAIADYVEPHWRGAGLALDHEWILRRLQLSSERREDAEDRADAAEARLAKAVEALRPFANEATRTDAIGEGDDEVAFDSYFLYRDFRRARAALSELEGE